MKVLVAHIERRRSAADRFPNGLAYDVDDETRRSNDWRVVYWMRPHSGVHPLRHKAPSQPNVPIQSTMAFPISSGESS